MSDGPKVYTDKVTQARKEHTCCECGSRINRGEIYHVFKGLWDDWATFKSCSSCQRLRSEFDSNCTRDGDEPVCFGFLQSYIFDSGNQEMIVKFIDNLILRDKVIPDWMFKYVTCKNKKVVLELKHRTK